MSLNLLHCAWAEIMRCIMSYNEAIMNEYSRGFGEKEFVCTDSKEYRKILVGPLRRIERSTTGIRGCWRQEGGVSEHLIALKRMYLSDESALGCPVLGPDMCTQCISSDYSGSLGHLSMEIAMKLNREISKYVFVHLISTTTNQFLLQFNGFLTFSGQQKRRICTEGHVSNLILAHLYPFFTRIDNRS